MIGLLILAREVVRNAPGLRLNRPTERSRQRDAFDLNRTGGNTLDGRVPRGTVNREYRIPGSRIGESANE